MLIEGRCLDGPDGRKILVCGDDDFLMQAIVGGVLELGEEFLCLRDGDDLTPLAVPPCSTITLTGTGMSLRVAGREFAIGDRITGCGGHVQGDSRILPRSIGLMPTDVVAAWQTVG